MLIIANNCHLDTMAIRLLQATWQLNLDKGSGVLQVQVRHQTDVPQGGEGGLDMVLGEVCTYSRGDWGLW